jgi:hypothetical protein
VALSYVTVHAPDEAGSPSGQRMLHFNLKKNQSLTNSRTEGHQRKKARSLARMTNVNADDGERDQDK